MTVSEAATIHAHVALGTPQHLVALILGRTLRWVDRAYQRTRRTGSALSSTLR
jgi:hypothetical protein